MAAPEQAARAAVQAMACRSTHSAMILMNSGVKNLIVLAVVLVELLNVLALGGILIRMAMVGLMVVMAVHRLIKAQKMRLAVLAVYMVVVMVEMPDLMVRMQLIMVLAAAVVATIIIMTPISAM